MKYNLIKTSMVSLVLLTSPQVFAVCEVTPEQDQNGDGYDDAFVDVTARVSSDSTIQCDNFSTVGANSRIISGSNITRSTIASDSRLKASSAFGAKIGSSVLTRSSSVRDSEIGDNVRLINSTVTNRSSVADGAILKKSHIHSSATVASNARVIQSMVENAKIGADARIVRSNINYQSNIGEGATIIGATIDGSKIEAYARVLEGAYVGGSGQQVGSYSVIGKDAQILGGGFFGSNSRLGEGSEVIGRVDILNDVRIGKRTSIHIIHISGSVRIGSDSTIGDKAGYGRIKENVVIGRNSVVGGITIYEDVRIASNVIIGTSKRELNGARIGSIGARTTIRTGTVIGDFVTIGEDVIIRRDVRIGQDVVIGDGVIIRPESIIPDGTIIEADTLY